MSEKVVLITGVTGSQGGAVARELVGKGFKLRGMTRKLESDAAKKMAALGIELVQGDLDDEASLKKALTGAWGVFGVQNTWEAGVEKEEEQGKRLAQLAKAAGVQHYVYTSVGSAHRNTGIPHFENKWRVEEVVRGLGFASHVIFRPVFFMENLLGGWFLQGDKIVAGMKPDTKLQMIAVKDIGRVEAQGFVRAQELNRKEIDLAGDNVTMTEATQALSDALGRKLEFVSIPIDAVRQNSADFAAMLEWFEKVGYDADIAALDAQFGRMTRFADLAKSQKA
jgi:uncharacterized protein YbjT (DUF2867 family)